MTNLKTIAAISVLFSGFASPVFAQDAGVQEPIHHGRVHDLKNFRGVYNQYNGPLYATPRTDAGRNVENFDFGGRDPSWVGGEDPSLNPAGN